MTVELLTDSTVLLSGDCPNEDAETLLQNLIANPTATVDWRGCVSAHTSVVQVLLVARPPLLGPPENRFLRNYVVPLLQSQA